MKRLWLILILGLVLGCSSKKQVPNYTYIKSDSVYSVADSSYVIQYKYVNVEPKKKNPIVIIGILTATLQTLLFVISRRYKI